MKFMTKSTAFMAIALAVSITAASRLPAASTADALAQGAPGSEDDYDRLDGKGASGKKVDVVEWEGNLEVHVYPAGSLKGLALKLDKRNKDKPVMVIGYRFDNAPDKQIIRRAILGIEMNEGFKAFRDTTADGYDKVVISNNGLSGDLVAFKLDPEPKQLYPDGHPALAKGSSGDEKRTPAAAEKPASADDRLDVDENGTIRPFFSPDRPSMERKH